MMTRRRTNAASDIRASPSNLDVLVVKFALTSFPQGAEATESAGHLAPPVNHIH
jgi:hypothetical protein